MKLIKEPYKLNKEKKNKYFLEAQKKLTLFHRRKSSEYAKIIGQKDISKIKSITNLPFLSVNLFKELNLSSVNKNNKFKVLVSSGTSGKKSEIVLDKETANLQQEALINISQNFFGKNRMPMIIVDSQNIFKNRKNFSARTAAILGFSIFASEKIFLLNEKNEINFEKLNQFLKKHENKKILLFGFTFLIWKYLAKKEINISNRCIILHGGGWKKMVDLSVNKLEFNRCLNKTINIEKIINYYGMVEQVGSIFMECESGFYHCSNFSDIIVRDANFNSLKVGEKGLIQMLSVLPKSYPGHNLLTEDLGMINGEDNCKCGRTGKYFSVLGRAPNSETRGCSDTKIS